MSTELLSTGPEPTADEANTASRSEITDPNRVALGDSVTLQNIKYIIDNCETPLDPEDVEGWDWLDFARARKAVELGLGPTATLREITPVELRNKLGLDPETSDGLVYTHAMLREVGINPAGRDFHGMHDAYMDYHVLDKVADEFSKIAHKTLTKDKLDTLIRQGHKRTWPGVVAVKNALSKLW